MEVLTSLNEELMKKLSTVLVQIYPEMKAPQKKKTINKWNSSKKEKYLEISCSTKGFC